MPELEITLALLLSGLIGVSLGLLGGGGSILAVPVLVYVAGIDAREAITMSLAIVGGTSLTASFLHHRSRQLDLRVAGIFGSAGIGGALLGAQFTPLVSSGMLLCLFAGLMLAIGAMMLRRKQYQEPEGAVKMPMILAAGAGVGVVTGFLGVGGGFLVVPALVLLARLPMRLAVGTSLMVIAINSAAGLVGHLGQGHLPWTTTFAFTVMAVGGSFVGEKLVNKVQPATLRTAFAVLVILTGFFLAARNCKLLT